MGIIDFRSSPAKNKIMSMNGVKDIIIASFNWMYDYFLGLISKVIFSHGLIPYLFQTYGLLIDRFVFINLKEMMLELKYKLQSNF